MKLRSIVSVLAFASTGCTLLAPVEEHEGERVVYYLGGPAPARPDSSGLATDAIDAGGEPDAVGADASIPVGAEASIPDAAEASIPDAREDAPRTCERAFDDAGAGPTCPTLSPARYACTFDWDNGPGCDRLGQSGGRWWVCC